MCNRDGLQNLDSFESDLLVDTSLISSAAFAVLGKEASLGSLAFLTAERLCLPATHNDIDLRNQSTFHHFAIKHSTAECAFPQPRCLERSCNNVDIGTCFPAAIAGNIENFAGADIFDGILKDGSGTER